MVKNGKNENAVNQPKLVYDNIISDHMKLQIQLLFCKSDTTCNNTQILTSKHSNNSSA